MSTRTQSSRSSPRGIAGRTESSRLASQVPACARVSVVLPCLNEEQTLATCITKAQKCLGELQQSFEVVVSDNGSTDRSIEIATQSGARVVNCSERGYGAAIRFGILASEGEFILVADADDSYALDDLAPFVSALEEGADMVLGNRFDGGIQDHAMPALNRYLGNPLLTGTLNLLFRSRVGDAHCGLRGFRKSAFLRMNTRSTGMEFASETVVLALRLGMRLDEVPTTLAPDGRNCRPHLRPLRDGWRHLSYLLVAAADRLLLLAGASLWLLAVVGVVVLGQVGALSRMMVMGCSWGVGALAIGLLGSGLLAGGALLAGSSRETVVRSPIDRFGKWLSRDRGMKRIGWGFAGLGAACVAVAWVQSEGAAGNESLSVMACLLGIILLGSSVCLLGVQLCQRFHRMYGSQADVEAPSP